MHRNDMEMMKLSVVEHILYRILIISDILLQCKKFVCSNHSNVCIAGMIQVNFHDY